MRKLLAILLIVHCSCNPKEPLSIIPEIQIESTSFDTTDEIEVKLSLSSDSRIKEAEYLVKWDWEGDGIFDTPYSSVFFSKHRYPEPGNYTLTVMLIGIDEIEHTSSTNIEVLQGYSKPIVQFTVNPKTGNPKTVFRFDGSTSYDAEEETEFLTFSWDFNNDHHFEHTELGNPLSSYLFSEPGDHMVRLVVVDTSGLSSEFSQLVQVTMIDTLINPVISYTPEYPTDWDTIRFDASESFYHGQENTRFEYLFKEQNGSWKEAADSGIYYLPRPLVGISVLSVKVIGPGQYYQEKDIEFQVTHGDRPPSASFERSSRFGNIRTNFLFDAWGSSDKEDMPSELRVKWDFDGDGSWDTPYSTEKYARWTYDRPGKYMVVLGVIDSKGGTSKTEMEVLVSGFDNPTGYVLDQRSVTYYGTVEIGGSWWMSENLRYNPNKDTIPGRNLSWCYDDNAYACWATGKLYNALQILDSWNDERPQQNICPDGWRLPSASEWKNLIENYGFDLAGRDLYHNGKSDFNALYGGYAGYHQYGPFREFEMDSIYKTAVFMTSDLAGGKLRTFQLKRDSAHVEERHMVLDGYYSIRCIKK